MSRFITSNVPKNGTNNRDRDSRAHKGIGTFVPSRFPSRFAPAVSRFVGRGSRAHAHLGAA